MPLQQMSCRAASITAQACLLGASIGKRGAIDNANGATPWTPQIAAVAHPFEEGFHRRATALGAWHANQLRPFHQGIPWPQEERPARLEECNRAGRCGHTAMAWSATRPLASARPPHGDTTEHLQCQRPGCADARIGGKRPDQPSSKSEEYVWRGGDFPQQANGLQRVTGAGMVHPSAGTKV
jgi:hypothetical protein